MKVSFDPIPTLNAYAEEIELAFVRLPAFYGATLIQISSNNSILFMGIQGTGVAVTRCK